MKRLLYITTRLFWPADNGRKVTLDNFVRTLAEVYGYEVYLYSFLDGDQHYNESEVPAFVHQVEIASGISVSERIRNIVVRSLGPANWPLQCSLYYSNQNKERIQQFVERIHPDVIITDMIRTAMYLDAFAGSSARKIFDLDDILSTRYKRQLNSDSKMRSAVTGAYAQKLPAVLNRWLSRPFLQDQILKFEIKRLAKWELYYAGAYDQVILISGKEARIVNEQLGARKAYALTIGVDIDYFTQKVSCEKDANALSFLGNMNTAANADSLRFIVTQVLPRLNQRYILNVVGSCPETVGEEYKGNGRVRLLGRVHDTRVAVQSAQVFVAPILYGSGIKNKIVEAMAMGMPVVTNAIGAEGMDVMDGRELLLAETPEEIAQAVERLMQDETLRLEMGQRAQAYVRANHDWREIQKVFGQMGL